MNVSEEPRVWESCPLTDGVPLWTVLCPVSPGPCPPRSTGKTEGRDGEAEGK